MPLTATRQAWDGMGDAEHPHESRLWLNKVPDTMLPDVGKL
jgi:hypothetical protein